MIKLIQKMRADLTTLVSSKAEEMKGQDETASTDLVGLLIEANKTKKNGTGHQSAIQVMDSTVDDLMTVGHNSHI